MFSRLKYDGPLKRFRSSSLHCSKEISRFSLNVQFIEMRFL